MRFLVFLFSIVWLTSFSQDKSLSIIKTKEIIEIDGELTEAIWKNAEKATVFHQNYPSDTISASTKTEAMVTYDDLNIYVAAICYDDFPDQPYVVQSLKRDFSFPVSDGFAIFLDPFNDQTNGFSFGVNPLGVQREGLLQGGGQFGVSTDWDNKWFSAVKKYDGYWTVEMKIPFKSIRYNHELSQWGINFARNDLKRNELSCWAKVPQNFNVSALPFAGKLNWDNPPPKAGANISLIPYVIGGAFSDHQANTQETKANTGFDAKIAVTSSLNLDITVNPDFSQVEVDDQVTNLSRFSLFFPEKRQFFIENSDLFSRFGFRQIRPFFSRRIGLNNGNQIPILAGARLSGKLSKNWRVGLMNMQTEGVGEESIESQNYAVGAIQRTIGERSTIDAIVVNRQAFVNSDIVSSDYNRVVGLDYNLRSKGNKVLGKVFLHKSFTPNENTEDYAHASWLMYNDKKMSIHWNHEFVAENYNAEVGFVPRISQYNPETGEIVKSAYWRLEPSFNYRFFPKSKKIFNIEPGIYWSGYFNNDYQSTENRISAQIGVNFISKSFLGGQIIKEDVLLNFATDITFAGNTPLDSGYYSFNHYVLEYWSSQLRPLNYGMKVDYGNYFTGQKLTIQSSVDFRIQPWGVFGIRYNQNEIFMPNNETASLILIGPKIQLSFTQKLFLSTFIQYNTQIENMNINARLQYRFRPMSDLFIVYTDNYNTFNYSIKNRALLLKLVYWLNV